MIVTSTKSIFHKSLAKQFLEVAFNISNDKSENIGDKFKKSNVFTPKNPGFHCVKTRGFYPRTPGFFTWFAFMFSNLSPRILVLSFMVLDYPL